MDLDSAIEKHSQWKVKLRSAIAKQESLDVDTIGRDDACGFGKWLHSQASSSMARLPSYAVCVAKHAAFHVEASKVAKAINAGNMTAAESMLGSGTPYTSASAAVGVAIVTLKMDAEKKK